ncbi:MAG: hypothetical protein HQ568_02475 [Calditrichaeota bacterium]|nr:hypothetical protein [Calditrichota bacterium]
MKTSKIPVLTLIGCLLVSLTLITACDDERTPPSSPSDTTYSETIILVDNQPATGQQIDASFTLLDDVKEGFIKVTCFFDPEEYLTDYEQYGCEGGSLETDNEALNVSIINLGLEINELPGRIGSLTADTTTLGVRIDSLDAEIDTVEIEIQVLEDIDPRSEEEQDQLDTLQVELGNLQLRLEDWGHQKDSLTVLRDSLRIRKEAIKVERETYIVTGAVNAALMNERRAYRDILDIYLDNLYRLSLGLGSESRDYFPNAVFVDKNIELTETFFDLDTTFFDPADGSIKADAVMDPAQIDPTWLDQVFYDSLLATLDALTPTLETLKANNDTGQSNWTEMRADLIEDSLSMVWGQGVFLAPEPDNPALDRGISFRFDLDEFWVADSGWTIGRPFLHETRPEWGSAYSNQYPVRYYLSEMTEGSHTLHFRFGSEGTDTKLTVTLYVVYYEKVGR